MEMEITFPGGARVDAAFGPYIVPTDQPPQAGGEGMAPTPFAMFLASIGTCAGIYVLNFLRKRGLSSEGMRLIQRMHVDQATGMLEHIDLEIQLPSDFPKRYHAALARAAELCAVKKHLEHPPTFNVSTHMVMATVP